MAVSAHDEDIGAQAVGAFENRVGRRPSGRHDQMRLGIQSMPAQLANDAVGTIQALLNRAVALTHGEHVDAMRSRVSRTARLKVLLRITLTDPAGNRRKIERAFTISG